MVRLSVVAALMLCACRTLEGLPPGKCDGYRTALAAEDPAARAARLVREQAPRFLAVQGYVVEYPGVKEPSLVSRLGYSVISGTSDAVEDDSCRIFQKEAREYAELYNRKLIELMEDR